MRASDRILLTASENDTPVFNLQAFEPIGENHYSALFSTTARSRNFKFEDYKKEAETSFKGKLTIAASSLFRLKDNSMRCILAPQTDSRKFEEDKLKIEGFSVLRANLFEDATKNIWKVVGEGDNKQLVRVSPEDFGPLLEARRKSMPLTASENAMNIALQFGDYAYYFNPEITAFDFGIYGKEKGKGFVISRRYKKVVPVKDSQILEAAASDPSMRREMTMKWNAVKDRKASFTDYLDFIGMLYGKNSEYYKANERAIMDVESRVS